MPQHLTISVEGQDRGVPVERLLELLTKTLAVLRDIDLKNGDDGKPSLHWSISKATTNSPLELTFSPQAMPHRRDTSRVVVLSYMLGMRKIESGKGVPSDFGDDGLKEARGIVGLLDRGLSRIAFGTEGEEPVVPTLRSAALIDEFFGKRSTYHLADTTI